MIGGPTNLYRRIVMLGALLAGTAVWQQTQTLKGYFRASAVKKASLGFWAVALVRGAVQSSKEKLQQHLKACFTGVGTQTLCRHEPHHEPER